MTSKNNVEVDNDMGINGKQKRGGMFKRRLRGENAMEGLQNGTKDKSGK